ncbi:glycosyltransferase family 2 protein [Acinetobacter sp. YH12025]|uniref:glycosyltransferase family 2 protein n=1 Tax=Acinetobacter sp. YH12025 TaxID=2601042 RepID=UPI0015D32F8F|nr:glycosyltransferase family 2 protein [Acinetobacter sp. YH12025]
MSIILSIVVPTYNVEKFIGKCASSILSQVTENVEVIFINDCSTDNSEKILFETIEQYPDLSNQIRVIRTSSNSGIAAVRNLGIQLANGDYIYQIDGDDYWEKFSLIELINILHNENPDVMIFDYYINSNKKKIRIENEYKNKSIFLNSLLSGKISPSIWNKIFKKNIVVLNNLKFNDGRDYGEDYFFVPQLIDKSNKIYCMDIVIYNYNIDMTISYTKGISEKKVKDLKYNIDALKKYFKGDEIHLINVACINKICDFIWKVKSVNDLFLLKRIFGVVDGSNVLSSKYSFLDKIIYKLYSLNFMFSLYVIVKIRKFLQIIKKKFK